MTEKRYYYLLVNVKRMTPSNAMGLIEEQRSYFTGCVEGAWEKYVDLEIFTIEKERKYYKREFPSSEITQGEK